MHFHLYLAFAKLDRRVEDRNRSIVDENWSFLSSAFLSDSALLSIIDASDKQTGSLSRVIDN